MSKQQPIAIFSLTAPGYLLARRIYKQLPVAIHYHRPTAFAKTVQEIFTQQVSCIFICSTGIVMRILAPVLRNKYMDPAVLVLDEAGRYVIPLLSGHEGGGCEWGRQVSEMLCADIVITSATDYSQPVYTVGMGCARGCSLIDLKSLYSTALNQLPEIKLSALASIDIKGQESGLIKLSQDLQLLFKVYPVERLREVEDQLSIRSEIVFNEVGCYGVAEAAALCAAAELTKQRAELVLNKQKNARATVAIARSYVD